MVWSLVSQRVMVVSWCCDWPTSINGWSACCGCTSSTFAQGETVISGQAVHCDPKYHESRRNNIWKTDYDTRRLNDKNSRQLCVINTEKQHRVNTGAHTCSSSCAPTKKTPTMNALQAIGDSQTEIWRNPQANGCHSCCGLSGKISLAAAAACSTKPFFWLPPVSPSQTTQQQRTCT